MFVIVNRHIHMLPFVHTNRQNVTELCINVCSISECLLPPAWYEFDTKELLIYLIMLCTMLF